VAVRPKYSCGTAVVLEQPAKAFSADDRSSNPQVPLGVVRKQQDVTVVLGNINLFEIIRFAEVLTG
jgi:hypothetical protein